MKNPFFEFAMEGSLRKMMEAREAQGEGGLYKAASLGGNVLRDRWRDLILGAGLGTDISKSIRAMVYPKPGRRSMEPVAFVFSKAPTIVRVFGEGAEIRRRSEGLYLWIPTEHVPRRAGRRRMDAMEVEEHFGDFIYVPSLTRPGIVFATVEGRRTKRSVRFKRNMKNPKQSKNDVRIIMFVLVRQVRLRKRYDFEELQRWARDNWSDIAARSLAEAFRNDPEPAQ